MVKPVIGNVHRANPKPAPQAVAPAPKPEPKGLPKPIAAPQKQEDPDVVAARAAVENFEVQRRVLREMKEDWERNYPEANQARQDILRQEDLVTDAVAKAKPLIAKVKQSIGEFTAQRKFSKAHYDEEEVTKVLTTLENRLAIFDEMLSSGIVSGVGLNQAAALAWFAQRPDYAEAFQPAFKDEAEMTCAVSVPKI
jgi:hypothetical protein